MLWNEIEVKEEVIYVEDDGFFEDVDWMGIDAFHAYWMDESDPRQTKRLTKEEFEFEQASGSGEWDY